jgi:competence protein ComEC
MRDSWLIRGLHRFRWKVTYFAASVVSLALLPLELQIASASGPRQNDCAPQESTVWRMFNVSPGEEQADCHLITFPDGRNVLVDIGEAADAPGTALAAIRASHVTCLDLVVISHFHKDHYGQLLDLIDAGIQIKSVALNIPDEATARAEQPWGCRYEDVLSTLDGLRRRNVPFFVPSAGDCLVETISEGRSLARLEVVCLFQGENSPVGHTDVNDTSIIVRLTHGSVRALFTGDLNRGLGTWLAESELDLAADLLKVPHHGTEGCAPNEFFDRVRPKAALVPSPTTLWASARSMRIRNYFADRQIPTYVSGSNGMVTVIFKGDTYSIESER